MEQHELSIEGCKFTWWMRGQGPAIMFIQGCGVQGNAWLPQVEKLAENYTCIWFDNRVPCTSNNPYGRNQSTY